MANRSLEQELIEGIRSDGPIPFSAFMEEALYNEEHGFYSSGVGRAGRRGDFITSVEVGPLFGAVVARALDQWWDEAGQPNRFVMVELGAGVGTLAIAIRAAKPRCLAALVQVLVERSPVLRDAQNQHLEVVTLTKNDHYNSLTPGVYSSQEISLTPFSGVILANELIDNISFDLFTFSGGRWQESLVGVVTNDADHAELAFVERPASADVEAQLSELVPHAEEGWSVPWLANASDLVKTLLGRLKSGYLVLFDYGTATTAELAEREGGWMRVYRNQSAGGHPLEAPGSADITTDVAFDQLSQSNPAPTLLLSQSEFLERFGIAELVEEGRELWRAKAAAPDLQAVLARSRISESEALLDPDGLGSFLVAIWQPS